MTYLKLHTEKDFLTKSRDEAFMTEDSIEELYEKHLYLTDYKNNLSDYYNSHTLHCVLEKREHGVTGFYLNTDGERKMTQIKQSTLITEIRSIEKELIRLSEFIQYHKKLESSIN